MRSEKRWLKQVIKEVADKQFEMPWEQDVRPVAFVNIHAGNGYAKAA
jgi:hypothetical protein